MMYCLPSSDAIECASVELLTSQCSCGTEQQLFNQYWYWSEPTPPNKNRGTQIKLPTVKTELLMPVLQQDHSQHLRFKRMI